MPPLDFPFRLDYADRCFGIGSCFVESIGQYLQARKFSCYLNPQGIVFNPHSIAMCLQRLNQPKVYTVADLHEHQGLWHSFDHHGQFSAPDPATTLARIHDAQQRSVGLFQQSTVLLLTLGTANVWEHQGLGRIVANCHKWPGSTFQRRRMEPAEITEVLGLALQETLQTLPKLNVVLTVSPVRYLREGLIENNRSKASLLLASEALSREIAQVHYFPAYELVMDDLRDYRFYAADLAHPSPQAVEYVWRYFSHTFFTPETQQQIQALEKLSQALQHRPLHPNTTAHQHFLAQQLEHIKRLEQKYPTLDFSAEKTSIQQQLLKV